MLGIQLIGYISINKEMQQSLSSAEEYLGQLSSVITNQEIRPYLFVIGIFIIYLIYLASFKDYGVIMSGKYDQKLKNIGKTTPPFPNGWFVVCKSNQLLSGQSMAIDQSGLNITIFRNTKTQQVYAINSYCAHLGANLGVGGKVVKQKCIQCPFHGWMYDGESGACVNHDGKQVQTFNVQYNDSIGQQGCKQVQWIKGKQGSVRLRKYHVRQAHGFIYVWIHSDQNRKPQFQFINVESYQKKLTYRGFTKHTIYSHVQDIPENGADVFHFRYVHKYPFASVPSIQFIWHPDWKTGDDPELEKLFCHPSKGIHQFKQGLYKNLVQPLQNKQHFSFASIDNYISFPFLDKIFVFNLTIIQMGPGLVFVFFKTHFFTTLFIQYVQTKQEYKQVLYHQMFSSYWLPYWVTAIMLRGEGIQVYNDMLVWNAKKFGHKIHFKDCEADRFILKWRKWFSKYYQGCKEKKQRLLIDW